MSNPTISLNGNKYWVNKKGQYHRTDGPAIVCPNGTEQWYINGELHRIGGPAIIYPDGEKHWYKNGKRHRTNGPAIMWPSGAEYWYKNGKEASQIPDYILLWEKRLK